MSKEGENKEFEFEHAPLESENSNAVQSAPSQSSNLSWRSKATTLDEIVERFAVIGEEDTTNQKVGVSVFGVIAFAACTTIAVFFKIKYN